MKIMDLKPENCKNCYKCLRNCHVKAIRVKDDRAEIVEDKCVACGECFTVCPQNARSIHSDVERVKGALNQGKKAVVTMAPSGIAFYPEPKKVVKALKELGFQKVMETGVGAEYVSAIYTRYVAEKKTKNMITSCCPTMNLLIQRYFTDLTESLIPVVSPMVAHSRMIKQQFGEDTFVVFIGPCISKICEAYGYQQVGEIDAVITFEELEQWMKQAEIDYETLEGENFDTMAGALGLQYPNAGGIIKGIETNIQQAGYIPMHVTGIESCKELFTSMINGEVENVFVEVNACSGGCINGPAAPKNHENLHQRRLRLVKYLNTIERKEKETCKEAAKLNIPWERSFTKRPIYLESPSDKEMNEILKKMGKVTIKDELNCGACGYNTCREKAKAIFQGMSQPEMCIPYMRSKAERLSNLIFEHSPNVILLLDESLSVVDANPTAEKIFMISNQEIKGKAISTFIDDQDFQGVVDSKESVMDKKVSYLKYGIVVKQNIVYLPKQQLVMVIMHNMTEEERRNRELAQLKQNTLDAAQNVINKQMRVAQEIASLLGETTAETKVTLLKLQQIVRGEEGAVR